MSIINFKQTYWVKSLNNKDALKKEADWFEKGLLRRVPENIRDSFSTEQLSALKVAFGTRNKWGQHPIDLRGSFSIWRWRYYFVVLAGRNKRLLTAREKRISLMVKTTLVLTFLKFLTFSTLMGLLVLYLIKSAMGIDILPGFSLNIWGWFKGTFL